MIEWAAVMALKTEVLMFQRDVNVGPNSLQLRGTAQIRLWRFNYRLYCDQSAIKT